MGKVTIQKARKILGKLAENVSDEELEKELNVAHLLKRAYFDEIGKTNHQYKNYVKSKSKP